jgi:hypothetical protein
MDGLYTFAWTISNGICPASSDTVQISTSTPPSNAFAGPDQSLCLAPAFSMNATGPASGSGNWTYISGPNTPSLSNVNDSNAIVSGIVPGVYIYRWTVSNSICPPSTDDTKITVYAIPSPVDAGLDQQWCDSTQSVITGNIPSLGVGFWSFINGPNVPTVTSPANPSVSLSNLVPGTYGFQWTIVNGLCLQSDQMQVTIDSTPVITVTQNYFNSCQGDRTVMLEASGANTYQWSPVSFLDNPSISNPIATFNSNIVYWVTGYEVNGCYASDSVVLEVCDSIFISNGFSPDDDGINDEFVIVGLENYPDNFLHIFNRWGNMIYEK